MTEIVSFSDKETSKIWGGNRSVKLPGAIQDRALRKLRLLDAANVIEDLRNPPGNNLESLKGERKGQMSIRINDQWRICFEWLDGNAYAVEITDYHK